MSMLAEPRKKQRWTLNPRGKQWSDDQNKFGQKILEKMGWTAGKGLGANEQGMTDHIRVKYKGDQAGIGYSKDIQDKLWTEHQESFNDLLQKLHNDEKLEPIEKPIEKGDLSGKSLELKSKQSRVRVHYHKFTRGKDVNKYSTKDLANIFGKKDLNVKAKDELNEESSENEEDPEPVGATDKTAGVLTIKGGMITDYFKNKIPLISSKPKRSRENPETCSGPQDSEKNEKEIENIITGRNEGRLERDLESESERYVGFGYSISNKSNEKSPGKSKGSLNPSLFAFTNSTLDFKSPKSTPKKRKSEFYCSTPAMEEKKEKRNQEECEAIPKKRKTEFFAFENPELDLLNSDPSLPLTSSSFRNKMEVLRCEAAPIECIPREEYEKREEGLESAKKKKKKKRKDTFVEGFVNDGLNINDKDADTSKRALGSASESSEIYSSTEPPPPFLRNKMEVLRSEVMPIACIPEEEHENREEPESAKKKKKKKKKDPFIDGFVNDALNVDDRYEESLKKVAGNVSECFEVSRSDVFGLANDALDLTDETNGKKRVTFNDVVEYNTNSAKKKKKSNGKLDKFEVDIEKSKKKKPSKGILVIEINSFVNQALDVDVVDEEMIDNEENERKMNKEKRRKEKGKRMSNLETIKEVLEEEEEAENDGEEKIKNKNGNEGFDDSLVKNTSDEFGEMSLVTPIKKKKKKKCKEKKNIDENFDGSNVLVEDQLENDESSKKRKEKKKIKEMNDFDDSGVKSDEQSKKKKKKIKVKNEQNEDDMEIDEDFEAILEENSNKENENSHDAKDSMKAEKKEKGMKKNKDGQTEEPEEDVENEEKKKSHSKKVKVSEIEGEVVVAGAKGMNNETNNRDRSENIARSQWESKSKRPKRIFRALFAKGPVVHFPGSSINEIKGYGMP